MIRTILTTALASVALLAAGPAMAKPGGNGKGGGHGAGAGASAGVGHRGMGAEVRAKARVKSQGPSHASDRALDRANENSVLGGTVRTRTLAGLNTGMTVRDTNGTTIGTITRVLRSGDGTVRNVLVRAANGRARYRSLRARLACPATR